MTMWRASTAIVAAGLMLGAATMATAEGHEMGQMGPGMMGQMQGMGPGGPMMGPGMMGPGQMAPGMMGQMGQGGPMMGPGMMGPGHPGMMMGPGMGGQMMGPGMMGQGMAPGMMGPGQPGMMMGPGMMGQMGPGMMGPMGGLRVTPSMHVTTDDVRHFLEHHLTRHGFEHLKVGEVTQTDPDTITADVVTTEGSLAVRIEVDTHTGWVKDLS
jgi:hypothetical protein